MNKVDEAKTASKGKKPNVITVNFKNAPTDGYEATREDWQAAGFDNIDRAFAYLLREGMRQNGDDRDAVIEDLHQNSPWFADFMRLTARRIDWFRSAGGSTTEKPRPSDTHVQNVDDADAPLAMLRGIDVEPVSPKFFVHPYFPDGSLSILFGDPGVSKSLLVLWMLARISRGLNIFGTDAKPANVMMLSNEDPAEVSMGRYLHSGGDPERITFEHFTGDTFALAEIGRLKSTIEKYRPKVVVIDSIMSHVGGKSDVYRPNEVSALLSPLQAIAQEYQIVVIGLMHMNKQDAARVIYRVGGSIAFVGAARSAMYLDVKPDEPNARILCHVKANYSAHGASQEIEVLNGPKGIAKLVWNGPSELTANDLLAKPEGESSGKKLREAEDFINDLLNEGPMPSVEIYTAAEKRDISAKTLERAKKSLRVESFRSKDNSKSLWRLGKKESKNRVGEVQ